MKFFGQNNLNAKTSFQERALYKQEAMLKYDHLNLTDFYYKSPYYGKVDRDGNSVFPDESFLTPYNTNVLEPIFGMNFVVRAFENFQRALILNVVDKNGIRNYNSNLLNLVPYKGFQSINSLYYNFQNTIYSSFMGMLDNSPKMRDKICDYKSFLQLYLWFMGEMAPSSPVTKCGFIRSKFCTNNISGLIVEIDTGKKCSNDIIKQKLFFDDPLFDYYVKTAVNFLY